MTRIDEPLLAYFRQRPCDLCGRKQQGIQVHHVECRGPGGGSRLDVALNLLSLCVTVPGYYSGCHDKVHGGGKEAKERCLQAVAKREGLESGQVVQEAIWRLLRTPKG